MESNGNFTVKSAYKVANNMGLSESGDQPDQEEGGEANVTIWKFIWKLHLRRKIENFMWRAFHGALHLKVNLVCRGMDAQTHCSICLNDDETTQHLFFECE
ncbi:zf-RVT domain-containing protein [Cephalotus follicularis]|uniref:Zf-RVT domain-containing protein n=1 Tax=Cephalotus follicularis TaxID=3775 RepID=A0A1Q3DGY4_CEPFO|nr:zf-RVT domain-containing protein [Cephalotus follicularis]